MQRESLEMDESQALRRLLSVRKISSVFSSFPDLPHASSVGSLNHATLPTSREEECCLYPQHEHISRFYFLLCLSVFACTPVHSNSPTISTDSLACFAGALTKQLSDSSVSQKHVQRACLILTQSTRVFHKLFVFVEVSGPNSESFGAHDDA